MDAPIRAPSEAGGALLERLLDEAERGMVAPAAEAAPATEGEPPSSRASAVGPPTVPATPPVSGGDVGGLLGGLLGNPSVMAALPTLLESLGPLLGGGRPTGGSASGGSASDGSASGGASSAANRGTPPAPLPVSGRAHTPPDRHTALLCAVKPYLSPERQAAADTLLRLCRVWDALARSGVTPGSLGVLFGMPGGAPGRMPGGTVVADAGHTEEEVT